VVLSLNKKCHLWMAPGSRAKSSRGAYAPLATRDVRRLRPHQVLGLETLLFFRLTQSVGATNTLIILSLSKRYGADRRPS